MSFEHLAAISLDDVVVITSHPLPVTASCWPVRFLPAEAAVPADAKFYVLCGQTASVRALIERGLGAPLYVLTDSREQTLLGRLNVNVEGLGDGTWESSVNAVCSRHVRSVPWLVFEHARRSPNVEAVCDVNGSATYSELCSMAWRFGEELVAQGVPHSESTVEGEMIAVGVMLEPSVLCCAALLGLALRRITAVAVASQPGHRKHMLESVHCVALLVEGAIDHLEDGHGVPLIRVDLLDFGARDSTGRLSHAVPLHAIKPPPKAASLGDVAFVGWTSGSTGLPKGMGVTSWRLAHWSRWRTLHTPVSEFGRRAAMNLFWIWYWHIPLTQGRALCITPSSANTDVISLVRYLGELRVDYVDCLTPGQLSLLTELCDDLPPTLKHIFSSGEALPVATARAFVTKFPHVRLHNLLATTETTADICMLLNVNVPLCDRMDIAGVKYVPVLDVGATASIVWQNSVSLESETGRLIWKGCLSRTQTECSACQLLHTLPASL